ncbi:MAG: indole-3-glycerol-phosphate synthase TrpC, partial [Bacteroidales bacterium]|nr:indole-3-glycerol-phosphate synthase TrpC [Bacteroidales bacterium]
MKDVLSEIIAHKQQEVDKQKKLFHLKEIEKRIELQLDKTLSLKEALLSSSHGIIAEFKRK